jgi:pyruvate dehydrogenase E2 component (dihydrolipoamide acetyltransferase)
MWHPPNDPHVYGSVDIDMTEALRFLEEYNRTAPEKVTITHLVVRAVAMTFARHPELNACVSWRRILLRPSVDVFCQVAVDGGRDLSGVKIPATDKLSLGELAQELRAKARHVREDQDPAFKKTRNMVQALPLWLLRFVIRFLAWVSNTLNLDLPKMGLPRDPFGSAMVTSVGMFGIDTGFAPLTPIARCPFIVTVTRVRDRPWVVGDRVEPRPVLRLCAAFDHRVIDGAHGGQLSGEVEHLLMHPREMLTERDQLMGVREAGAGQG